MTTPYYEGLYQQLYGPQPTPQPGTPEYYRSLMGQLGPTGQYGVAPVEPFDPEEYKPDYGWLGNLGLGFTAGLGQSVLATGQGLAAVPSLAEKLVPDEIPGLKFVDRFLKGLSDRTQSVRDVLAEQSALLEQSTPGGWGTAGAITGRLAGDVAQIAGTAGLMGLGTRGAAAANAARGVQATGLFGREAAQLAGQQAVAQATRAAGPMALARGAAVSAPVAGLQALGSPESSTAAALGLLPGRVGETFEAISEDPLARAATEVGLDFFLGYGIEKLLARRGLKQAKRLAAGAEEAKGLTAKQAFEPERAYGLERGGADQSYESTYKLAQERIAREAEEARARLVERSRATVGAHQARQAAKRQVPGVSPVARERELTPFEQYQVNLTQRQRALETQPSSRIPEVGQFQQNLVAGAQTARRQTLSEMARSQARAQAEASRADLRQRIGDFWSSLRSERGATLARTDDIDVGRPAVRLLEDQGPLSAGETFFGVNHSDALAQARRATNKDLQQGFDYLDGFGVHKKGTNETVYGTDGFPRFLTRNEAEDLAVVTGKLREQDRLPGDIGLISEQLGPPSPVAQRGMQQLQETRPLILQETRSDLYIPPMKDADEKLIAKAQEMMNNALGIGRLKDQVAQIVKRPLRVVADGLGTYRGQVTPNSVIEVADEATANKVAAILGFLEGQHAEAWIREVPRGTSGALMGLEVRMRPQHYRTLNKIINSSDAFEALDGSTYFNGTMKIVNFGDTPDDAFRRLFADVVSRSDLDLVAEVRYFRGGYLDGPSAFRGALDPDEAEQVARVLAESAAPTWERIGQEFKESAEAVRRRIVGYLGELRGGERGATLAGDLRPLPKRMGSAIKASDDPRVVGAQYFFKKSGAVTPAGFARHMREAGYESSPELLQAARKRFEETIKAVGSIPTVKEMDDAFKEGIDNAGWYRSWETDVKPLFDNDADYKMFTKMYAATSQRTDAETSNLTYAIDAFIRWKEGKSISDRYGTAGKQIARQLQRAIKGEPISGAKISRFEKALLGDENVVVLDKHMIFFLSGGTHESLSPVQYVTFERMVQDRAKSLGITPRTYQETVWKAVRDRTNGFRNWTKKSQLIGPIAVDRLRTSGLSLNERGMTILEGLGQTIFREGPLGMMVGGAGGAFAGGFAGGEPQERKRGYKGDPLTSQAGRTFDLPSALVGGAIGAVAGGVGQRAFRRGAEAAVTLGERGALRVGGSEAKSRARKELYGGMTVPEGVNILPPRRGLGHPRPKGEPKGTSETQMKFFGLDDQGTAKLEARKKQLIDSGQVENRKVTWEESHKIAEQMGFADVQKAYVNNNLDGVTMIAIKDNYVSNTDKIVRATKRLEQIEGGGGARYLEAKGAISAEGSAVARERRQLVASIEQLERENEAYVKMYLSGASEAGRTLNALRSLGRVSKDPFFWRVKATKLAGRDLLEEEWSHIKALLDNGNVKGVADYIVSDLIEKTKGVGMFLELRRAGLLTGLRTQARNFLSNTAEWAMRYLDDPSAAMMDRVASSLVARSGGPENLRTRVHVPLARRIEASKAGVRKALSGPNSTFRRALRGEMSESELRKLDLGREVTLNNRFADAYVKFMFRLQGAVDQPARQAAFMESLYEQAAVLHRGLKGEAREAAIRKTINAPPDDFVIQAIVDGEEAVFQNVSAFGQLISSPKARLRTLGAQKGIAGQPFRTLGHALEFVVPFANTPGAVLGRLIERTPLGMVSSLAGLNELVRATKAGADPKALAAMQREISTRFGRSFTGTFALLAGMYLAAKGKASGRWPDNQKEADRWMQEGKSEDSVMIGGKWRKLTGVSPLGNLVALGAQFMMDAKNDEYDVADKIVMQPGLTTLRGIKEQSFLRGLNDLMQAIDNRRGGAQKFAPTLAGSFVPIAVADFARAIDPVLRDARNPVDGLRAKVPIWSMTVPAKLDEFGEPKQLQFTTGEKVQRVFDPFLSQRPRGETSPLLKELTRTGATVGKPDKREGETEEEYRQRLPVYGQETKDVLQRLFSNPRYQRMDTQMQQEVTDALVSAVRSQLTRRGKPPSWVGIINRTINSVSRRAVTSTTG